MANLTALSPSNYGMGIGTLGQLKSGTRVQIEDDNSGVASRAVLAFDVPNPRICPFEVYRTNHIFYWGSNDSAGVGADTSASDVTHPAASAWFTGTTSSTAHVTACSGGAILFCLFTAASHVRFYDTILRVPVLSTGAQQFRVRFGWDNALFGAITNGVYVEGDSQVNANYQFITVQGGTATTTDTGVPIVAGAWVRGRIEVVNNTTAKLWIVNEGTALGGSPTSTVSTNIPSGTGQGVFPNQMMESIVGTGSKESDNIYFICGMDRYAA